MPLIWRDLYNIIWKVNAADLADQSAIPVLVQFLQAHLKIHQRFHEKGKFVLSVCGA